MEDAFVKDPKVLECVDVANPDPERGYIVRVAGNRIT